MNFPVPVFNFTFQIFLTCLCNSTTSQWPFNIAFQKNQSMFQQSQYLNTYEEWIHLYENHGATGDHCWDDLKSEDVTHSKCSDQTAWEFSLTGGLRKKEHKLTAFPNIKKRQFSLTGCQIIFFKGRLILKKVSYFLYNQEEILSCKEGN